MREEVALKINLPESRVQVSGKCSFYLNLSRIVPADVLDLETKKILWKMSQLLFTSDNAFERLRVVLIIN